MVCSMVNQVLLKRAALSKVKARRIRSRSIIKMIAMNTWITVKRKRKVRKSVHTLGIRYDKIIAYR